MTFTCKFVFEQTTLYITCETITILRAHPDQDDSQERFRSRLKNNIKMCEKLSFLTSGIFPGVCPPPPLTAGVIPPTESTQRVHNTYRIICGSCRSSITFLFLAFLHFFGRLLFGYLKY